MQRKIYRVFERKNARALKGARRSWYMLDPDGRVVFTLEAFPDSAQVFDGEGTHLGVVPKGDQRATR